MIDKFWKEHNNFWTKHGYFKSTHIWITAENPDCIAHEWHKNYSSPFTEVLGWLGCKTSSNLLGIGETEWHTNYSSLFTEVLGRLGCKTSLNLLGIGEAERHWKITKRNKGGQ